MSYGSVPGEGTSSATKTPRLDPVIKTLATQGAKTVDKELAKLQTFLLDSLTPLTTILEYGDGMSVDEVKEVSSTAVELLGNANTRNFMPQKRQTSVIHQ